MSEQYDKTIKNDFKHELDLEINNIKDNIKKLKNDINVLYNIKIKDLFSLEDNKLVNSYDYTLINFIISLYVDEVKLDITYNNVNNKIKNTCYNKDMVNKKLFTIIRISNNCYIIDVKSTYYQCGIEFILNAEMYNEFENFIIN